MTASLPAEAESTLAPGKPAGSREHWIDLARFLGAFLVVLAHVVVHPNLIGGGPYWAQTLYFSVSRLAVPLFFMISGYLLLPRQESLPDFFRKRALKVLVPFLVWSLIYLIWWNGEFTDGDFSAASIWHGLAKILRGPREAHLWFFYALIGLYLITPTLRILVAHATDRDLAYFCGLWFLVNGVLTVIRKYADLPIGLEFYFVTGYVGYYVLGLLLGRLTLDRRRIAIAGLVFLCALLFTFAAIYVGSQAEGYDQFFESYLSFNVILLTSAAFVILKAANGLIPARAAGLILPFSRASLGIYLIHVMVLAWFDEFSVGHIPWLQQGSTIIVMPGVAAAAFVVCFAAVYALQKIPLVRYSVPW